VKVVPGLIMEVSGDASGRLLCSGVEYKGGLQAWADVAHPSAGKAMEVGTKLLTLFALRRGGVTGSRPGGMSSKALDCDVSGDRSSADMSGRPLLHCAASATGDCGGTMAVPIGDCGGTMAVPTGDCGDAVPCCTSCAPIFQASTQSPVEEVVGAGAW